MATTIQQLVNGLRLLGNEVEVIRPGFLSCEEEGLKVPSIALPGYSELRVGLPSRQALQARWTLTRPDVVYVATETPLGSSAISAGRKLNIPVASGFHTNFQQYVSHYGLPILKKATVGYLRRIHNRSSCTFVPSRDLMEQLRVEGFENLEKLPKGVDTRLFTPERRDRSLRAEWGVPENGGLVALFVGRIAAEKNLPLLMETLSELRRKIDPFQGVVVGDGPRLEAMRQKYPEFVFAGMRFGEDLARHYASADLFVFPSLTETFGNVTLEAMASGLGVVAFDYAAAREHIEHGVSGYRVPFESENDFLKVAVRAAHDPRLSAVRSSARHSALKVDWNQVVRGFEKTLARLADQNAVDQVIKECMITEGSAQISI